MATKKSKTSSSKTRTNSSKTAARTVTKTVAASASSDKRAFAGFFARKYDQQESIATVFKNRRFYGALLGEVIGTMLVSMMLFALLPMGIANIGMYLLALIAILIAVFAFSGACLNPIITVGMMASRRMSVIRGVMYIIAEIVGAWLAWLIFNAFQLGGGEAAYEGAAMAAVAEGGFWSVAIIEFLGAILISFFFARAIEYKRSVFTFAAVAAGGVGLAILIGYVVSAAFYGFQNNFIFNPAVALMMKIFPESGNSFGEILGGICQALSIYAIIPMIGGVLGSWLSDFTARLSAE